MKTDMKTDYIYIIVVAVVVIILGFVLWDRNKTQEVDDQIVGTSTSTPTDTQNVSRSDGIGGAKKPTPSPSNATASKPIETPTQDPVPSIPSVSDLYGSIFRMTSYNGTAVSTDSKYSLSFENGSLTARFCNSISGDFVLDGNLIKANNLISTKMYCATPSNLMEIESAFVSMLNFGAVIYQSGNKIILSHSQGTIMVFSGF